MLLISRKFGIRVQCFHQKYAKVRRKQNFKFSHFPKMGSNSPQHSTIFYQTFKAVTCKCQLSGVDPPRGDTAAILAKNVRRGGSSGQTESRNMAATRFLDSATQTSYSTPNTLWGLSRTVTELPPGAVIIAPLLRPPATRSRDGDVANFERTLLGL